MSRIPILFPDEFRRLLGRVARARGLGARLAAWATLRPRHLKPVAALLQGLVDPISGLNMGETAEVLAREFSISREEQDRFAERSHARATAARKAGWLGAEIIPVFVPPRYDVAVTEDVGLREGLTLEALQKLKPWFDRERGTVTPGNSSMVTDGAVALVLASEARARELGLRSLVRIRAHSVVGLDPRRMGLGPVFAAPRALERAGLRLADMDLIELNEAFAAQVLACLQAFDSKEFAARELGLGAAVGTVDPERLNPNGGAIALGHPVGASGARLVLTLAKGLVRRRLGLGIALLCVGGGQGQAVILEASA